MEPNSLTNEKKNLTSAINFVKNVHYNLVLLKVTDLNTKCQVLKGISIIDTSQYVASKIQIKIKKNLKITKNITMEEQAKNIFKITVQNFTSAQSPSVVSSARM